MHTHEPELRSLLPDDARRIAGTVLSCLHREYPNQIAHVFCGDADAGTPRRLHPAFFGCYDWHSAVHGHWCLVRLVRIFPDAEWAAQARSALGATLTKRNLAVEAGYCAVPGRGSFERPYGLAWVLQLDAELREWDDPEASEWASALGPLVQIASDRLEAWLTKLPRPIRSGVHTQSAFSIGLALDWSRRVGDDRFWRVIVEKVRALYLADAGWRLAFEPSGHDFLSPSLGEADLMRRVLDTEEFARWFGAFLPELSGPGLLGALPPVATVGDLDGQLAHLDGLNLSRAWMLDGICAGLPRDDGRIAGLRALADAHAGTGNGAIGTGDYMRTHWVGSFAVYLMTNRGMG